MYTRTDIGLDERMEIFSLFWRFQSERGFISELAERWQTSRNFIYEIAQKVEQALSFQKPGRKKLLETNEEVEKLQQRIYDLEAERDQLAGQLSMEQYDKERARQALFLELSLSPVSEDKIARCMRAAFGNAPSAGWINRQINEAGKAALSIMQLPEVRKAFEEVAIDEIFNAGKPILTMVDPHSLMMALPELSDNRQAATWNKMLQEYKNLELVASDQARGLLKGVRLTNTKILQQADLFHFKRNLHKEVRRLESSCYHSMELVEKARELIYSPRLLDSARIQAVIEYQQKVAALDKKLEAFDWLETIIEYLEESISVFDFRRQSLRTYQKGQSLICEVLELLDQIKELKLKDIISIIEGSRQTLLTFLAVLEQRLKKIRVDWAVIEGSRDALFSAIARVWYWKPQSLASDQGMKQYLTALVALRYWQKRVENFSQVSSQLFEALEQVVRASSAVECINSILRPYISVKKHLNQGFLALIALYWNMRPIAQRGGKTPFQLSGIYLGTDDWIELIQVQQQRRLACLAKTA